MAKAVGLDIGSRSIKIAEVEGTAKKHKITRFASCELTANGHGLDPEEVTARLAELLRTSKVGREGVIAALPAHAVTIREITVPFKTDDQIRKVVKFEAETHLHATAIEDVVVEYLPVSETADGTRLVIFAAPKAEIRDRLDLLKTVEIDPRAIDLDVAAIFNALAAAGLARESESIVVADIGATATKLLLIQNGRLRAVRSLRTGTESITRQLESDLDVPFEEAEERQALGDGTDEGDLMVPLAVVEPLADVAETSKSADRLEKDLIVDRRRGFLDKVSRELTRSMAALSATSQLDAFYVTGGGSRSPEVAEDLGRRFGVAVEPLDLLQGLSHGHLDAEPADVNAGGAVAIGLALKQLGAETIDIDFRQEEFAFARKFEIVKLAIAVGISFVFILVFLYFLFLQRQVTTQDYQYHYLYEDDAKHQHEKTMEVYDRVLPDKKGSHPFRPRGDLQRVKGYEKALLGVRGELVNELGVNPDIPRIRSSLTVLRSFFERIRTVREKSIEYLRFVDITLTQTTLRVRGAIGSRSDIGVLRRQFGISEDDVFEEFEARNQSQTKDGHTNLDIEISLREQATKPVGEAAMSAKKGGGSGEIDAIKAFIVIMAVLTAGLAIYTLFVLRTKLDDLDQANDRAKEACKNVKRLRADIGDYLEAYEAAREQGGGGSPEEYFEKVRETCGIPEASMSIPTPARDTGRSRDYREVFALIQLKKVSWDQAIRFMWNAEHNSPKYRILTIDDLKRSDPKSDEDRWNLSLKAAYRTQPET